MALVCLGINHKTAPVEVRERFAFSAHDLLNALGEVRALEEIGEDVVLSTCNRVEVYAACQDEEAALARLEDYLRAHFGFADDAGEIFYHLRGVDAVRHLYRVASGLDSMVLGETEIFGQVKKAYRAAHEAGVTSRGLNQLFQQSFQAGKLIRSTTHITRGATSVGSVAVDLAEKIFGGLGKCVVMILGAGEMSRRVAKSLLSRGAKSIIVSNRSYDRAEELAKEMGGKAVRFDDWVANMDGVDIVISSTGAPHAVIDAAQVRDAMRKRRGKSLFIIDIAVPRDVEAAVAEVPSVYLYDIDALEAIADDARRERENQMAHCDRLIEERVREFDMEAAFGGTGDDS